MYSVSFCLSLCLTTVYMLHLLHINVTYNTYVFHSTTILVSDTCMSVALSKAVRFAEFFLIYEILVHVEK